VDQELQISTGTWTVEAAGYNNKLLRL